MKIRWLAITLAVALSLQRGGGRGGVQPLTITTNAWADGGVIPDTFAQPGHDVSPPLTWSWVTPNPPENVASFVLIVHDLDAPVGSGTDDLLHWLVWNIPAATRELPRGVPQGATLPDGSRQISATGPNYRGPAAPPSGPPRWPATSAGKASTRGPTAARRPVRNAVCHGVSPDIQLLLRLEESS
jgi:hypothetical protein